MPSSETITDTVYRAFSGRVYKAAPQRGPVPAVLTYPLTDYAGDEVRPGGGDWSGVSNRPFANWTHEIPVGVGAVSIKALTLRGETHPVDFGETTFFQSAQELNGLTFPKRELHTYKQIGTYSHKAILTAAEQVERLVRDDVANGVSVEFKAAGPKGQAWWDLDTFSELERRPCRHYEDWIGLAYAHALQPVNPGARTLLTSDVEHMEKAIKIAETGRLGSAPLCDVIAKSFRPLANLARPNNRISVRVENKAMDDDFDTPPGGTVSMDEETPVATDGPTPAVKTLLEGSQFLLDLADQLDTSIGQSEHKKARKYVAKIIAELQATAEEMSAMAEKVRAELEDDEEPAEVAEGDEPPVEDDAELDDTIEKAIQPLVRDKDGFIVCKSFPNWKPQRARFADLKDIPATNEVDPAEAKAVLADLAREQRKARPYLRALRANAR